MRITELRGIDIKESGLDCQEGFMEKEAKAFWGEGFGLVYWRGSNCSPNGGNSVQPLGSCGPPLGFSLLTSRLEAREITFSD
jgi:hypothetical protein